MGSRGRPLFDLNEPPTEEEDNSVICFQPKKAIPILNPRTSGLLFPLPEGSHRIVNNHAFTHASSGSGFQPFVRFTSLQNVKNFSIQRSDDSMSNCASMPEITSDTLKDSVPVLILSDSQDAQATEREEGELEGNGTLETRDSVKHEADNPIIAHKQGETEDIEPGSARSDANGESNLLPSINTQGDVSKGVTDDDYFGQESIRSSEGSYKGNMIVGGPGEMLPVVKKKENRGIEASHTSTIANNHGKKSKLGEHKEAMLGKKRARQTVFINVEDAKQAGPMKTSMPRRRTFFPAPVITRTVKDTSHASLIASSVEQNLERQIEPVMKDQKQFNLDSEGTRGETNERKTESNADLGLQIPRQSSLKQSIDHKMFKDPLVSSKRTLLTSKKHLFSKKQTSVNIHYHDTSVERLLREVTNDKF